MQKASRELADRLPKAPSPMIPQRRAGEVAGYGWSK